MGVGCGGVLKRGFRIDDGGSIGSGIRCQNLIMSEYD